MLPTYLVEGAGHQGTMVALMLPRKLATKLAVPNGLPPEEFHITLGYFGKDLSDSQKKKLKQVVQDFAATIGPIKATLGGVGRFSSSSTSDGKDVAYLSVDSPDITDLRPKLLSKLKAAGIKTDSIHGFVPHVTLKYIKQTAAMPIKRLTPIEVTFPSITVAIADKHTSYKFGKNLSESKIAQVTRNGRDFHVQSPDGELVARNHHEVDQALVKHLPAGFKVGGGVLLHRASVRHGVPADYSDVDGDAIHILHPKHLAQHGVNGNELSPDHVDSIHKAWNDGIRLNPVDIDVTPDNKWHIEDGNHRVHAAAALDKHLAVRFRRTGAQWTPQRGSRDISDRILSTLPNSTKAEASMLKNVLEQLNEALKAFDLSDTPEPRKKGTPPPIPAAAMKPKAKAPPPPVQAFRKAMSPISTRIPRRLPGVGESLADFVDMARALIEGAPGKLQDYHRGSRGADSGRSFVKKQTSRAMRRKAKVDPENAPTRVTRGRAFMGWKPPQWNVSKEGPMEPKETLAQMKSKLKGEDIVAEGGGTRARKFGRKMAGGMERVRRNMEPPGDDHLQSRQKHADWAKKRGMYPAELGSKVKNKFTKPQLPEEAKKLTPFSLSAEKVGQARAHLAKVRQDAGYSPKPDVTTKRKVLLRFNKSED